MKNKKTALERIRNNKDRSLKNDTRGLSTVEYLILLVVIAVAGISVWKQVGTSIKTKATTSKTSIDGL
jgi:Flp pilus assembly pilin Flp